MPFSHIAEQRIREAMEQGHFDNLPGAGQPLNLEDYFSTPEDLVFDWITGRFGSRGRGHTAVGCSHHPRRTSPRAGPRWIGRVSPKGPISALAICLVTHSRRQVVVRRRFPISRGERVYRADLDWRSLQSCASAGAAARRQRSHRVGASKPQSSPVSTHALRLRWPDRAARTGAGRWPPAP